MIFNIIFNNKIQMIIFPIPKICKDFFKIMMTKSNMQINNKRS